MIQSEILEHDEEEEIVKELCASNGVCYETILEDGSGVTALERFFSGFPRIVGLSLFPRLSSLTIIGQTVEQIQGLDNCPLLTQLWVAECQLGEISGLQNCTQLQKLFLYDNEITEISNLELLTNLQVLWLNNNLISHIQGLSTLTNLKELNLAENFIETIGHSLDQNTNLQILSLSGNRISSFKELTHLSRLENLRDLGLKEPQCSPNPVCLLCNYSTHILYHIPTLHTLDSYHVSSRLVKEAAESRVMKKMMYYNMRVRLVQRQFGETQAKLQQDRHEQMLLPEERITTLMYTLKSLECELSELTGSANRKSGALKGTKPSEKDLEKLTSDLSEPEREQKLQNKLDALRRRIAMWERRLQEVETCFQQNVALASDGMDLTTHFLMLELETVGNIHFEEGNSSCAWFGSCYDLLLSRFCVRDYRTLGVSGIKIKRILRVHNRYLRLRFEDKLHSLLASDEPQFNSLDKNSKSCLECLFYVSDPEKSTESSEFLHILEHGFESPDSYKAQGRTRAVPLSNSVNEAERPRLRFEQRRASWSGLKTSADLHFRHGQLIVSKVFLGHSVPMRNGVPVDSDFYLKAHSVYHNMKSKQHRQNRVCSSEPQLNCDCSQRHTLWYVFDHELVLPEYLVQFEYLTQDNCLLRASDAGLLATSERALDEEVMALEPRPKLRPKLHTLENRIILSLTKATILNQITVLNLHGTGLSRLKELSHLTALRFLTISFNELTQLSDISYLPNLECVDASFNRVSSLEGVRGLMRLRQLDLSWNRLTQAREDAMLLRKHAPSLLRLDTRHNPWTRSECVRMVVLGQIKTLTHLDGVLVSEDEARAALHMNAASKINTATLLAHSCIDVVCPRCLSLLTIAQLLTRLKPSPWTHSKEPEPGWSAKVTVVNLDGLHLSRITNLDKLVNLRWASFNNNELTRIEGLEHCPLLEELSLDNNNISSLDGLSKLQSLTRLSINSNQVQCLGGSVLEHLPHLHFLSAESNRISSLHGVQRSRSLFELYVANNFISTSRDIYHLKALTSLVILDLYGNPLPETLENYRLYVVFHLPSLRMLDCTAVEIAEIDNSRELYRGRLNPDMVEEKLGHSDFRDILNLELTYCSIRMVDLSPVDLFVNLLSVNLEGNSLTSFSGLIDLPNLTALFLNHNNIETILPRQKMQNYLGNKKMHFFERIHSSGYGQQNSNKVSREAVYWKSLEPLMPCLEVLHLGHNGISNLTKLEISRLRNLKTLHLQGNEISQVEGLEGLLYLRELVLDRNRIRALGESSFCGQTALLELHLAENRIRELSHLHPLIQLHTLFLDYNKVQDIAELDKLTALPSLVELSVVGNPVTHRALHRPEMVLRFPRLQILDSLAVTLEERSRAEILCAYEEQYPSFPGMSAYAATIPCHSIRGPTLGSGIQHLLGNKIITSNLEDAYQNNKSDKKRRVGVSHSCSVHHDSRHRGSSSSALTPAGLHITRAYTAHPNPDSGSKRTQTHPHRHIRNKP